MDESPNLLVLGPGNGSKAEALKAASNGLRGHLAEELATESNRFSNEGVALLKFHGVYQQEDRDARQDRKAAGVEKAYQMMVRSRIPGGVITADAYLAHDDLAGRYANETLRITTRQGFQLHGVLKGDLHAAVAAINATLLSTLAACGDVSRNVMACPAPAASPVHAQIQDVARAIAAHLSPKSGAYHEIWIDGEPAETNTPVEVEEPIYGPTYLPRKFKIGIAAPGDNCVDIYTQDIGLAAHAEDGRLAGFTVLVGGGLGSTHGKTETYPRLATPLCFVAADEVIAVVEAVVTIQRDYGDRANRRHARMKYLVEERGIEWFRVEAERRLGRALADPRPVRWLGVEDHLGWGRQADGSLFLGLFVENGRIKDDGASRLRGFLREAVATFQPGVRLTGQQNILLTDIPPAQRPAWEALLADYGVLADPEALGLRRLAMACPALPTCGQALAEAERALPDVVRQLQAELAAIGRADARPSIRMTGCPNGCARPYMGDIGFVGRTRDVYNVYVGGDKENTRLNALYADSVHVRDLAATIRPLFALWREQGTPAEGFGDFCHRLGVAQLRERAEARII